MATRTLAEAKTPAEAKIVLIGRLQALSRSYTILANAAWEGAPLNAILDQQFAGFSQRVDVSGCDIVVTPAAAQQFALITHELATNALKYGALSEPSGRIAIEGNIADGKFSFNWRESGGPATHPPSRKGFGTVILLDSAKSFAQDVLLDYAAAGLTYRLQMDLSAIAVPKKTDGTVAEFRAS